MDINLVNECLTRHSKSVNIDEHNESPSYRNGFRDILENKFGSYSPNLNTPKSDRSCEVSKENILNKSRNISLPTRRLFPLTELQNVQPTTNKNALLISSVISIFIFSLENALMVAANSSGFISLFMSAIVLPAAPIAPANLTFAPIALFWKAIPCTLPPAVSYKEFLITIGNKLPTRVQSTTKNQVVHTAQKESGHVNSRSYELKVNYTKKGSHLPHFNCPTLSAHCMI
ncbi:hypothetical protein NQ318_019201 [Aromia moschata]|uniref:Uncharacterized protein n=1 Tax=Aromia moschata TaxID=1265417 RepID=A0AAV8YQH9_9CUCU|nr:hypothetical protein NQ318_019201 [Aromia moschata]